MVAPRGAGAAWAGIASPLAEGDLRALFDGTAGGYDRAVAAASLGRGRRHRRDELLRAGLRPGAAVLDVATGTGQVALEARRVVGPGGTVVGVDPSPGMLREAQRTGAANELLLGRAEALPVQDACFDLVVMGYALRHVGDLAAAFREFRRVLRPGGQVLVLEVVCPPGPLGSALARFLLGRIAPLAALLATGRPQVRRMMAYHWRTIELAPTADAVVAAMREAGLASPLARTTHGVLRTYRAGREA